MQHFCTVFFWFTLIDQHSYQLLSVCFGFLVHSIHFVLSIRVFIIVFNFASTYQILLCLNLWLNIEPRRIPKEKRNSIHIRPEFVYTIFWRWHQNCKLVSFLHIYLHTKQHPMKKYRLYPDEKLLARHTIAYNAGITDRTKILQETPFQHQKRVLYLEIRDFFHVVQAKESPRIQKPPFQYTTSYLQYLLCPAKSSISRQHRSNLFCNLKNIWKHKIHHTRLPPEPWIAGNNPVSSRRNPLDSACCLNLHSSTHEEKKQHNSPTIDHNEINEMDIYMKFH